MVSNGGEGESKGAMVAKGGGKGWKIERKWLGK